MKSETQELLEILALKLGTTVDYLWGVLIRQAQIDALTTLFQFGLIALFGIALYRLHKKFSNEMPDHKHSYTYYVRYEESLTIPMFVGFLTFSILVVCAFFAIGDLVNGFFNPEFWALDKILSASK